MGLLLFWVAVWEVGLPGNHTTIMATIARMTSAPSTHGVREDWLRLVLERLDESATATSFRK